jgi:hypothetical protein
MESLCLREFISSLKIVEHDEKNDIKNIFDELRTNPNIDGISIMIQHDYENLKIADIIIIPDDDITVYINNNKLIEPIYVPCSMLGFSLIRMESTYGTKFVKTIFLNQKNRNILITAKKVMDSINTYQYGTIVT